jgi:hypothetical protein
MGAWRAIIVAAALVGGCCGPAAAAPVTPSGMAGTSSFGALVRPAARPHLVFRRFTHVPTWAYDDGCGGGVGASAALVRQWLTYAESHCGSTTTKAMSDCHAAGVTYCTAIEYLDPNWVYQTDSDPGLAAASQETWWLHEPGYSDAAHRIWIAANGGGNLLNQSNSAVQNWFKSYVDGGFDGYDGLMMDYTSGSLSATTWGTGFATTQEIQSDAALQASHDAMAAAMTHVNGHPFLQIDNGLNPNDNLSTPFPLLNTSTEVEGLVAEGFPMADGTLTSYYGSLLDEMAYVDHTAQDFIVLLSYDTSASVRARLVQAATELLVYDGNHLVSWSDLETVNADLSVWPEEGIVPTEPLQSMGTPSGAGCLAAQGVMCSSGGHNDLQVAPGVYRREFRNCYDQGSSIGPCAAIVNTTGATVTVQGGWLSQAYGHQLTLSGGDVQSGGTVNPSGAGFTPSVSQIAADSASVLTT